MPTLQLKALNKHSITHIMYIEMEMLSLNEQCVHVHVIYLFIYSVCVGFVPIILTCQDKASRPHLPFQ